MYIPSSQYKYRIIWMKEHWMFFIVNHTFDQKQEGEEIKAEYSICPLSNTSF